MSDDRDYVKELDDYLENGGDFEFLDYLTLMEKGAEVDALDFNYYAVVRAMTGVLSVDDYDELRDF
jgi:hypothetical protein